MREKAKAFPPGWWWPDHPSRGVKVYLRAHYEFDETSIGTDFPYHGVAWSDKFRSEPGRGWTLRRDHISNNLTADLIAAAERLSAKVDTEWNPGMPGGVGAEGATVWIPLLDGGLNVEFTQYEHQNTNRVHAYQKTRITGPLAFRVMLQFLGFESPRGRLKGETRVPARQEIAALAQGGVRDR
jgi:hypothetical protein